jgi:hypothetical protein
MRAVVCSRRPAPAPYFLAQRLYLNPHHAQHQHQHQHRHRGENRKCEKLTSAHPRFRGLAHDQIPYSIVGCESRFTVVSALSADFNVDDASL